MTAAAKIEPIIPDIATPTPLPHPVLADGVREMESLRAGGFSSDEIAGWQQQTVRELSDGGFSSKEIGEYFGERNPDMGDLRAHLENEIKNQMGPPEAGQTQGPMPMQGPPEQRPVESLGEAAKAGVQESVLGLLFRQEKPRLLLPEDAPMYYRIAHGVGLNILDLPFYGAGAVPAAAAGGAAAAVPGFVAGSAVAGPGGGFAAGAVTGAVGAAAAGGAGAFALPTALRGMLMDHYERGNFVSFSDFWERASVVMLDTMKSAGVGAATGVVGGATKALPIASPLAKGATVGATEIATMVGVGKAIEGQVPKASDFVDAAFVIAGMHVGGAVVGGVASRLRLEYARTGRAPEDVAIEAQENPALREKMLVGEPPPDPLGSTPAWVRRFDNKPLPETVEPVRLEMRRPEAKANPESLESAPPVELLPAHKEAQQYAKANFQGKAFPNTDTGWDISVTRDVLGHVSGNTDVPTAVALTNLDTLIERAVHITTEPSDGTKRTVRAHHIFFAPVEIEGRPHMVELTVREHTQGKVVLEKLRDMAVTPTERSAELRRDGEPMDSRSPAPGGSRPLTMAEFLAEIKAVRHFPEVVVPPMPAAGGGSEPPPAAPGGGAGEPLQPPPRKSVILDRIGEPTKRKANLSWDAFYTATVDDLHPIKEFVEAMVPREGGQLPAAQDPYILARLTRGVFAKAEQFINQSPFEFEGLKNVGKSLREVLHPVREDMDGFREYAIAKRTLELHGRQIETGVPHEEAQRVVTEGAQKYEQVFRQLQEFQDHVLSYLRDSGVISKETYEGIKEANRDYVPFNRLMEDEQVTPGGRRLTVRNPVKRIRGSQRLLIDPIESVIKNTYTFVTLAERNRVMRGMVELAESHGELGESLMQRAATPLRPLKVSEAEITDFLADHGIESQGTGDMTVFRPQALNLARDEVVVYRGGKREVYRVAEPVAQAVKAMDRETLGLFAKILSLPAKTLRATTGVSPDFMIRNIVRDQITAFSLSRHGYLPIYDALKGLGGLLKKDADYQDWLKSGGANSSLVSIDRQYIQDNIFKLSNDTGLMSRARNLVRSPLEMARVVSELLENSTRLGEFKRARSAGKDVVEAGFESREVTLDFARIGAKTRAMNLITAFWNAQVQGLDRMGRAFKENPAGMTAKVALSATLPSVLLWWANKDDERYKELPRWQKDLFWIVPTDKWVPAQEAEWNSYPEHLRRREGDALVVNKGNIWRIPKPFEVGLIFGSLPERALEAFYQKNPKAFKDFGSSVAQAFSPGYIPTAVLPFVEHFANRSHFTGRSIVPAVLEGVLPEYQYTEYTSETAKLLGKFVASLPVPDARYNPLASPAVLENYIRAWSGNTGRYALQLADEALQRTGVLPPPVKAASALADMPVVKAFLIRYPGATAQSIQDFYDRYAKSEKVVNTIHLLARQGDVESAEREMRLEQSQRYMVQLAGTKEALGNQMKFIRLIDRNPDIRPDEKRQMIDGIYYQMIQVAREGNRLFEDVDTILKGEAKP